MGAAGSDYDPLTGQGGIVVFAGGSACVHHLSLGIAVLELFI